MSAVTAWRQRLADQVERNARGLSGAQVARALIQVTDDVWAAGLDDAFATIPASLPFKDLAEAFDCAWMAVLAVRLAGMHPHPRRRR